MLRLATACAAIEAAESKLLQACQRRSDARKRVDDIDKTQGTPGEQYYLEAYGIEPINVPEDMEYVKQHNEAAQAYQRSVSHFYTAENEYRALQCMQLFWSCIDRFVHSRTAHQACKIHGSVYYPGAFFNSIECCGCRKTVLGNYQVEIAIDCFKISGSLQKNASTLHVGRDVLRTSYLCKGCIDSVTTEIGYENNLADTTLTSLDAFTTIHDVSALIGEYLFTPNHMCWTCSPTIKLGLPVECNTE